MTDARLAGTNLEILVDSNPQRRAVGVALDALIDTSPERRITSTALEVLVKGELFPEVTAGSNTLRDGFELERPLWRWDGIDLIPASFAMLASGASPKVPPIMVEAVTKSPETLSTGTWLIDITQTPQPDDIVVVCYNGQNTATPSAVTGLGASWDVANKKGISAASQSQWFIVGTGASFAGTITISTVATMRNAALHAYLIRGLGTIERMEYEFKSSISPTSGPVHPGWKGAVILAMASAKTGMDWPVASSAQPSFVDWTQQEGDIYQAAYSIPQDRIWAQYQTSLTVPAPAVNAMVSQLVIWGDLVLQ